MRHTINQKWIQRQLSIDTAKQHNITINGGMADDEAMGARVQAARAKAGLSQRGLAKKLGVSPQAVSKWEKGEAAPKLATARRFAALAGVTVEWLLSGQGNVEVSSSNVSFYATRGA